MFDLNCMDADGEELTLTMDRGDAVALYRAINIISALDKAGWMMSTTDAKKITVLHELLSTEIFG